MHQEKTFLAMAVLGLTRRPTTVNRQDVTCLQRIFTPSFTTVGMIYLVVTYLLYVLFILNNDDFLGQKISEMIPFVPIKLYKIHDLR